jgi:UDP-3-O-[3-hydroxymyristoyl] glucosamine N-acyltransferase
MKLKTLLENIKFEEIIGNKESEVLRVVDINKKNKLNEEIFWIGPKFKHLIETITNGNLIIPKEYLPNITNKEVNYIVCNNPRRAFQEVMNTLHPLTTDYSVSPFSHISEKTTIPKTIRIEAGVVIEEGVVLSDRCVIGANTVIKNGTTIAPGCKIGSNCTIGGVGFGYEKNEDGEYILISHIAGVEIEENVEIGNNTCIDRGVLTNTIIRKNVKIDNLVHISHGVEIDTNSMIIANSMIAGSVYVGKDTWIAPSASIKNGINIEQGVVVGLGAVVLKNASKDTIIIGNPGKELKKQ